LIAMLAVLQQNSHVRQLALGQRGDPVVILPSQKRTGVSLDAWRVRLAGVPQIKAISELDHAPWGKGETWLMLGSTPDDPEHMSAVLRTGFDYFDLYGQKLVAGRVFSRDRDGQPAGSTAAGWTGGADASHEQNIVVDRTFVQIRGYASPQAAIGQPVYSGPGSATNRIIGVVESRPHAIQGPGKAGTAYGLSPGEIDSAPLIRITASDVDGGLAAIRQAWRDVGAAGAPSIKFEDQAFEDSFQTFEQIARLFMTLALVAFAIAAAGLFGMAVHATQRRLHEIGVRKTLGSTTGQVVRLLLTDFSKPILIANLIAWPLGYLAVQTYLANFLDRVSLGPWPFALSLLITLAVAWIAVGGQTWRAASIRPARVLRDA
jgi:putative ABC transport system permease protein